jgi:small-conductance mechanosensitive channel
MKNIKLLLFFIFFLIAPSLYGVKIAALNPDKPSQETKEKHYYQISSISENSVKILNALDKIANTKEQKNIIELHKSLPKFSKYIDDILNSKEYKNLYSLELRTLQQKNIEISTYLDKLIEWEAIIKLNVKNYELQKGSLKHYLNIWEETDLNAKKSKAPKAILEQVSSVIKQIKKISYKVKNNYDAILTDLNIITTQIADIKNIQKEIDKHTIEIKNRIFYKDQPSLFDLSKLKPFGLFDNLFDSLNNKLHDTKIYFEAYQKKVYKFIFFSILLSAFILYYFYLYKKDKLFIFEESKHKRGFKFIQNPVSTIIIILVLIMAMVFPDRPKSVTDIFFFILIIPTFRVLSLISSKNMKIYIYLFYMLFTLSLLNFSIVEFGFESRILSIVFIVLFLYILLSILQNKIFKYFFGNLFYRLLSLSFAVYLLLSIISVASNIYGAVLLSKRIEANLFEIVYISIIFYAFYIILRGYVIIILRRRISTASYMLDKYSRSLESSSIVLIKVALSIWWAIGVLKLTTIYVSAKELFTSILTFSWSIASTTISVQSIVDFLFIVFMTWAINKTIKTILDVEIFARFQFPRGIPTAIKTTLNYIIIVSGFIMALSSLGITSQQFTVIFGALGVGIGFGIRNIIANFVSGIIMVFERPIQIGDTIEIAKTMGDVQNIGARSSTIKTFDGSEVIIPNADFISKEIINWTLSDNRRRKIILFKTDFDADIELVLKIMEDLAIQHKDVLQEPHPQAAFLGFGEYYLEFKLYFWLSDNIIAAQSELSISIYNKLKESGISMPTPKYNLEKS